MNIALSAPSPSAASPPTALHGPPPSEVQRGGAPTPSHVHRASAMTPRCESTIAVAPGAGDPVGEVFANLQRVVGASAPHPVACLRLREMDLVVCDGAGIALYSLRVTPSTLSWEQRVISYPPAEQLRALREDPHWARRARRLCLTSAEARHCRVPVGVVAAEARAVEEIGELEDGEEALYRLCEAVAAHHQALGKLGVRAGRHFLAEIEKARRPSHVPLSRFQEALAEELALGRSVGAVCSRSEGFSNAAEESKVVNLLGRRLGLLGHDDGKGHLRFARVALGTSAVLLCEALDIAPEQVGL
jgi:hypothetical protein